MALDRYQTEAVGFAGGPCMVLAGPGSGKTTVIVNRALKLIEDGTAPEQILVITFSKAAAREMRERFLKLSGGRYRETAFGTFHAAFFKILSEYYHLSGRDVATEIEKRRCIGEALAETLPELSKDREFAGNILREISAYKNSGGTRHTAAASIGDEAFGKIERAYTKALGKARKIDFDDMLIMTKTLFVRHPEVLADWQRRFSYIMVDEFQDINPVQYEIVKMLARPGNNLFIVGDDDQSVYGFRGARPDIMLNFPKDFPTAKRIDLKINYRSAPEIVSASGELIAENRTRYRKKTVPAKREHGQIVRQVFRNETEEAAAVAAYVKAELQSGVPAEKIAVLIRVNRSADLILSKFTEEKIPFYTRDRLQNIYEHHILDPVFAYLNYISGDHSRRNFLKFMNCPVRYIRREDLKNEAVELPKLRALYEADPERKWMTDRIDFLDYQLTMLEKLPAPYAKINFLRRGMEYDRYVSSVASDRHADEKELFAVLDTIQEDAKAFGSVADWYRHIVAYTKALYSEEREEKGTPAGKVAISTLHSAKGLEFESVCMPTLNEGILPHERAKKETDVEEERRLFYVGMTRAIKNLRLFSVETLHGKKTEISRFIKETGL